MYSVVIQYKDGSHEVFEAGLSYQEAIETVEAAKAGNLQASKNGVPVIECTYWITRD